MLAGWARSLRSISSHSQQYRIKKSPDWNSSVSPLCGYQMFKESTDIQRQNTSHEDLQEQWRSQPLELTCRFEPSSPSWFLPWGSLGQLCVELWPEPLQLWNLRIHCNGEGLCKSNPVKNLTFSLRMNPVWLVNSQEIRAGHKRQRRACRRQSQRLSATHEARPGKKHRCFSWLSPCSLRAERVSPLWLVQQTAAFCPSSFSRLTQDPCIHF